MPSAPKSANSMYPGGLTIRKYTIGAPATGRLRPAGGYSAGALIGWNARFGERRGVSPPVVFKATGGLTPRRSRGVRHSAASLRHVRAGPHQVVEPVHRLLRGPRDAAEQQHAEQRVVERPG